MSKPEFIDPSKLRPGPIRNESLSPELLDQIKAVLGAIGPFPEETGGFVDSFRCRASNSGGCFGQRGSYPGQWFAKTLTQERIPHGSLYRPDRVRGNGRRRRIQ